MKKEKRKERSIYILFKQTQRRCITIFSPEKEVRGAARGWEAVEAERGAVRPPGQEAVEAKCHPQGRVGGVLVLATSHCEIDGARCLVASVIFLRNKRKPI